MSVSKLCADIVTMATIDRSCPEIIDIVSAVEEMLEMLLSGEIVVEYHEIIGAYATTLRFRSTYLQPCGSMAERTSLWKSVRRQGRESKFLEFDYLAGLSNQDDVVKISEGWCKGCSGISSGNKELKSTIFSLNFLESLYTRITNMCSCRVDCGDSTPEANRHEHMTCDRCTVYRDTGYLQIARAPELSRYNVKQSEHCSLVLYWTSSTNSLLAPNVDTLQRTEKIKRLVIRVDVLPAFEFPGNGDGDQSGKNGL